MTVSEPRADGIRILRIQSPEEAAPYRASFAGAYQDIFSEPPYNERFSPDEAQGVLTSFLQVPDNITLLAVKGLGATVVQAIIAGRPYAALDDLCRVKGMGPKLLSKVGVFLCL